MNLIFEWINEKDEKPKEGEMVIGWSREYGFSSVKYIVDRNSGFGHWYNNKGSIVFTLTHWTKFKIATPDERSGVDRRKAVQ